MSTKPNKHLPSIAICMLAIIMPTLDSKADVQFVGDIHTNVWNYGSPTYWIIGQTSSGASMTVNGGSVYNLGDYGGSYLILGQTSTSTGDSLNVNGAGSLLTCGYLYSGGYGFSGFGNQFLISSGGGLSVGPGYGGGAGQGGISIGEQGLFVLTDTNSYLTSSGGFSAGNGSRISVLNSATFVDGSGINLGGSNTLLVSNSGTSVSTPGSIASSQGFNSIAVANNAHVTCDQIQLDGISNTLSFDGANTMCVITNGLTFTGTLYTNGAYYAGTGSAGTLIVRNGAHVTSGGIYSSGDPATQALVTDPGTLLTITPLGYLYVGFSATDTNAVLIVTNSASVILHNDCVMNGHLGVLEVTGTNTLFSGPTNRLYVGTGGGGADNCQILIGAGAEMVIGGLQIGSFSNPFNNSLSVAGNLFVTNSSTTAALELYGGHASCDGGLIVADSLICGYGGGLPSTFTFGSGTLELNTSGVTNGLAFVIGDGMNAASLVLNGGTNTFANGLVISSNAVLSGTGLIIGAVTNYGSIQSGGLSFSSPVVNLGNLVPSVSDTGIWAGNFGFTVTGIANQSVVVEASTNLADWQPVWTNVLSYSSTNFTDPQWTSYPNRFYRARSD